MDKEQLLNELNEAVKAVGSQRALADYLGVTRQAVTNHKRWINGQYNKTTFGVDTLDKLRKVK